MRRLALFALTALVSVSLATASNVTAASAAKSSTSLVNDYCC